MSNGANCSSITNLQTCLNTVGCKGYAAGSIVRCSCSAFAYGPDNNCHQCQSNEISNYKKDACVCYDGNGLDDKSNTCQPCTGNTFMVVTHSMDQSGKIPCQVCDAVGRTATRLFADDMTGNNYCICDVSRGFVDDNANENSPCQCQNGLSLSADKKQCVKQEENDNNNNNNSNNNNNGNNDNSQTDSSTSNGAQMSAGAIAVICGVVIAVIILLIFGIQQILRKTKRISCSVENQKEILINL